jgi:hypothetical protein
VSLPKPLLGLVTRYRSLWTADAVQGRDEGDKERPAAIVMVVDAVSTNAARVLVLPITHNPPHKGIEAIQIPTAVCRKAGLDAARSWVIVGDRG